MSSLKRVFFSCFVIIFLGFTSQVKATDLSWDVDSDGNIDALTDGLLLLRYTFGLRGNDLASGAVSTDSPLSLSAVETRIELTLPIADIDGSGEIDALTDGLIILRYLFDINDDSLISGVVADNATRSSLLEISQHLIDHMPGIHTGGLPSSLIINEAVSSNSSFEDEDGDSPDWFELFNNKSTAIDLSGWTVTDDEDKPTKWSFPDIQIGAGEYLRIWASDKDKANGGHYKTLINQGDSFRYLVPASNPSDNWTNLSYDDDSWPLGNSGFGYADGDDETQIDSGISSVYVRKSFTITNLEL